MSAALSLMIATYILVRVRFLDSPPAPRSRFDNGILIAAELVNLVCWLVIVVQTLGAMLR